LSIKKKRAEKKTAKKETDGIAIEKKTWYTKMKYVK